MDVRKFWLTNNEDAIYHLTDPSTTHFLASPQGLGITIDYSSIKFSNSELINSKDYVLGTISGDLLFYSDTRGNKYQEYFDFLTFVSKSPIYLYYQTPNSDEAFRCLVQITGLEKTEVDLDSILHCPVAFKMQTVWYSQHENIRTVTSEIENGKKYILHRPYAYGASSYNNVNITNYGNIETSFIFEVDGATTDLEYSISQNGEVYGRGKILGTYDYIKVDSDDLNEEIVLVNGTSTIPNAVNYQDLTVGSPNKIYITFLKLKTGTSRINFGVHDGFDGTITVRWRNAYLSV